MIKKSFILSCISAVALSLDDMEVETFTQVKADSHLDAMAMISGDSGDRRTGKGPRA